MWMCACQQVCKCVYILYTHSQGTKQHNERETHTTLGLGVYQTLSIDHGKFYPRMAPQFEM